MSWPVVVLAGLLGVALLCLGVLCLAVRRAVRAHADSDDDVTGGR